MRVFATKVYSILSWQKVNVCQRKAEYCKLDESIPEPKCDIRSTSLESIAYEFSKIYFYRTETGWDPPGKQQDDSPVVHVEDRITNQTGFGVWGLGFGVWGL